MRLLRRGQIVGKRYRIHEVLGSGGMGTVVAATDLHTGTMVALKVPHTRDVGRIAREAKVAARLTSPHVARVLETGTFRDGDLALPFIAFEYLDGVDLATWISAYGPMPIATAAAIVVQACHAIDEAHALAIVHRDLKPSNLFLTTSSHVKVLDFGISSSAEDERITATGALVGSPAYMAPERMRPTPTIDARGDIWSLGIVLYEAVTGRLPFASAAFPDMCLKILLDDMPEFEAPPGFIAIVRRCLEKEADARFPSAAHLARALVDFADPVLALASHELELLVVAQRESRRAPAKSRRRPVGWAPIAASIAALWLAPDTATRVIAAPRPSEAQVTAVPRASAPMSIVVPPPLTRVAPPPAPAHHSSRRSARAPVSAAPIAPQRGDEPAHGAAPPAVVDPLASPF